MAPGVSTWTPKAATRAEQPPRELARSDSGGSWSGDDLSSDGEAHESEPGRQAWDGVKTWSFAQMFHGKVSLEDNGLPPMGKKPAAAGKAKPSGSYTSLTSELTRSASSSSSNDWDCSYHGLRQHASISASSSSSTLCMDAEQQQQQALVATGSGLRHVSDRLAADLAHVAEADDGDASDCNSWSDSSRVVFDILKVIGSGSYGTVLLCTQRGSADGRLFAVKVVDKSKLRDYRDRSKLSQREVKRLRTEKQVLSVVDHPFITKLYCAFETRESLNFVLEYCPGGDMYFLLEKFPDNRLPETHVSFYAASIALALNYLHQRGIMYRDLKPENLLIDRDGFLRLADFGFARPDMARAEQICKSFCGSADYIAPEVARGTGYGMAADLWSFGCVVYELLSGYPPFYSPRDRAMLFRKIKHEAPVFPSHFSKDARSLVTGLLHKDAAKRLGNGPNGMNDVFAHPFFDSVDWYALAAKQVAPPMVPRLAGALDTRNFEEQFTSQHVDGHLVYEERDVDDDDDVFSSADEADKPYLFDDFDWCAEDAFMP